MTEKSTADLGKSAFELKTKDIEIAGNKFTIRELDFETIGQIEDSQIKGQLLANGKPHVTLVPSGAKYIVIQKGLVKAPFDISDLETIKHKIPGRILQELYLEIMDFNKLSLKNLES